MVTLTTKFFFLTFLVSGSFCNPSIKDYNVVSLPQCSQEHNKLMSRIIYVSTLDGRVSALDTGRDGLVLWSLETGEEMLSSSIQNRELTNSGHWVRMIPSLSGSLYKFDGETIDLVPITAEQLLTASFKYSDDLIFAGGKEISTFGVSLPSGRVMYKCGLKGCLNETKATAQQKDEQTINEDVLVIQKRLQTVHAIAPETGSERWNFSVGQHNLKAVQSSQCSKEQSHNLELTIKVVVPEGLVYAVHPDHPNKLLWQQKLNSPIVNVWQWKNGNLQTIEIFSDSQWTWRHDTDNSYLKPAIYVGMHNKQLYIQESVTMQNLAHLYAHQYKQHLIGNEVRNEVPRIPWRPYQVSSSAVDVLATNDAKTDNSLDSQIVERTATSLAVLYASKYINGNGFYLYTESEAIEDPLCEKENNSTPDNLNDVIIEIDDTPVQVIIVSLWYWWREILIISISTAILLNIAFAQRFFLGRASIQEGFQQPIIVECPVPGQVSIETPHTSTSQLSRTPSESSETQSRFFNEFEFVKNLGKGGFGTVFEARHKIANCNYAIKMIKLPNKDESRKRVMREVTALAMLDHPNIVRYFNAWTESSPTDCKIDLTSACEETEDGSLSTRQMEPTWESDEAEVTKDIDDESSSIVFRDSGDDGVTMSESKSRSAVRRPNGYTKTKDLTDSVDSVVTNPEMCLYIQMQLCKKESLKDWMDANMERNCAQIKSIFEQILSAVQYLHLQGLMHRDLKPSNILFSLKDEIKVGDFGLVTNMADEDAIDPCENINKKTRSSHKHTRDVGTQLYMSPEQLKGPYYNYKIDIYSLGVILLELLLPFRTSMERYKILSDLRLNKFPNEFAKKYKDEYELLCIMLAHKPEERPTTFGIRARPPFQHDVGDEWHFELPPRI